MRKTELRNRQISDKTFTEVNLSVPNDDLSLLRLEYEVSNDQGLMILGCVPGTDDYGAAHLDLSEMDLKLLVNNSLPQAVELGGDHASKNLLSLTVHFPEATIFVW